MAWDLAKCRWGVPNPFTDADAATLVANANFAGAVYVNISRRDARTKQAFTYALFRGYRVCVVGHVHLHWRRIWVIAGNCYIPGWSDWDTPTPAGQVAAIGPLPVGGAFPGDNRYPHPSA